MGYLSLRIILAVLLITVGSYFIINLFWKVGVSRERREAIVNRAGEIDLLNEFRRRREDLPTVPIEVPLQGDALPYQLRCSKGNLWSLISSATMSVTLVAIASILFPTAIVTGPTANHAKCRRRVFAYYMHRCCLVSLSFLPTTAKIKGYWTFLDRAIAVPAVPQFQLSDAIVSTG